MNARQSVKHTFEFMVSAVIAGRWSRAAFNAGYRRCDFERAEAVYYRFAKMFRHRKPSTVSGDWTVDFIGRRIRIPLRSEHLWLDWDIALSVLGHESAIKKTYAAIIRSSWRPDLFVDVGANYGTHSLLFLVHGIDVLAFEPNPSCREYFQQLCAANSVHPRNEDAALGDRAATTHLTYPRDKTWLGSTEPDVATQLLTEANLETRPVRQETLDSYLTEFANRRVVLKIDTEGNDWRVMKGAERMLKINRPLILFESWTGLARSETYRLLSLAGYDVAELPWAPNGSTRLLAQPEFLNASEMNFIAVPQELSR